MKKLLTLAFAISSLSASAQLEEVKPKTQKLVGMVAPMGVFVGQLYYTIEDAYSDTVYTLKYRDMQYTRIDVVEEFSFSGMNNAVDALYNILKKAIQTEDIKSYTKNIVLGKTPISIIGMKSMGVPHLMLSMPKGHMTLTDKQLDKLFGK